MLFFAAAIKVKEIRFNKVVFHIEKSTAAPESAVSKEKVIIIAMFEGMLLLFARLGWHDDGSTNANNPFMYVCFFIFRVAP